jgi:hypothetical protein
MLKYVVYIGAALIACTSPGPTLPNGTDRVGLIECRTTYELESAKGGKKIEMGCHGSGNGSPPICLSRPGIAVIELAGPSFSSIPYRSSEPEGAKVKHHYQAIKQLKLRKKDGAQHIFDLEIFYSHYQGDASAGRKINTAITYNGRKTLNIRKHRFKVGHPDFPRFYGIDGVPRSDADSFFPGEETYTQHFAQELSHVQSIDSGDGKYGAQVETIVVDGKYGDESLTKIKIYCAYETSLTWDVEYLGKKRYY